MDGLLIQSLACRFLDLFLFKFSTPFYFPGVLQAALKDFLFFSYDRLEALLEGAG